MFVASTAICLGIISMYSPIKNAKAASVNADNVEIEVYTEQGDDWFKAMEKHTTKYGTLKMKKMLPGKYRLEVNNDDVQTPQIIDVEAQMYDEKGRKFDDKVDVTVYAYIDASALPSTIPGDYKALVGIFETASDGVVELNNIVPGMEYKVEVDDNASLSKKTNKPRIKIKAKIDDSDWFASEYKRTDTTNTLKLTDVISGKYKFEYKDGDVSNPMQPFNLYIRLRDDDGDKIHKSKKVKIYTYINDQKIPVGEFMTTNDGKLYLPNVVPGEYKLDVK